MNNHSHLSTAIMGWFHQYHDHLSGFTQDETTTIHRKITFAGNMHVCQLHYIPVN